MHASNPTLDKSSLSTNDIYGYLNRVQSSRRLEKREAGRNVEVMWLTGRLIPDHKTIADFRKDNGPAIQQCLRAICRTVPRDGSAHESERRDRRQQVQGRQHPRQELHACQDGATPRPIEKSVARYLAQLDTADRQEPSEELAAKTAHLNEKLVKVEREMQRLAAMERLMLASPGSADLAHRSRQPLDGDQRTRLRRGRLQCAGRVVADSTDQRNTF